MDENCTDPNTCMCFNELGPVLYSLEDPMEYLKYHAELIETYLKIVYKHQVVDQLLNSTKFAFMQARFVKTALDSHIETLKIFESEIKEH